MIRKIIHIGLRIIILTLIPIVSLGMRRQVIRVVKRRNLVVDLQFRLIHHLTIIHIRWYLCRRLWASDRYRRREKRLHAIQMPNAQPGTIETDEL
jgi:hypothetical protein